jgi:hypothetical protein
MMKSLYASFIASLFAVSALGDTFTINERNVAVPTPDGFVRVTDEMHELQRYIQQLHDPQNDTLAFYIPESDVPAAMAGEVPSLERWFILKVSKKLRNLAVGRKDFSEVKEATKRYNREAFDEVKARFPEYMDKISNGISQEFDTDFTVNIAQVVPLEPHYESEDALGFSMYLNYTFTTGDEEQQKIVAATSTFLNTGGTILFLFGYGPQDQLEWTRNATTAWAESVRTSNHHAHHDSEARRGSVLRAILGKGLAGAAIGGLVALVAGAAALFKKRNGRT